MRGPFGQQAVFVKEKLCSLRPLPLLRCRPYLPPNRKRNTHAMWYSSAGQFRAVFLLTRVDRVMKKKDINTFKSPSTTSRFFFFSTLLLLQEVELFFPALSTARIAPWNGYNRTRVPFLEITFRVRRQLLKSKTVERGTVPNSQTGQLCFVNW